MVYADAAVQRGAAPPNRVKWRRSGVGRY